MTTIAKKMMVALALCSLSGIAHAAQKNKGFWSRLAGLCHTKSPQIQPQINTRYQGDEEKSRPCAPINNAFELVYNTNQWMPEGQFRGAPQGSPNDGGMQWAPLPVLDLNFKFNAPENRVPRVNRLYSNQNDINNLISPLPEIDPREEQLQEHKRGLIRLRAITNADLLRRPSLDATQTAQLTETKDNA